MPLAFLGRDLPRELERLRELALDLRWTWSHGADALWRWIDPASWDRAENAWSILQDTSRTRLEALTADAAFMGELTRVDDARRAYLAEPVWFGRAHPEAPLRRVAYFCMEFGLAEALPFYAGGLGVLAGDYLKSASDLGVPVVGVGLLYQEGFFRQMIDERGVQHEIYPYNDPSSLPLQPVLAAGGGWLHVSLHLPGRELFIRAWLAQVGRVTLYLLDTNDPLNSPVDRGITTKLYPAAMELRLLQEIVLGVGGWRLLEALQLEIDVCHLNDGHAALAVLERARAHMQRTGTGFWESLWVTRAGNVFTTHTAVDAAFDRFPATLLAAFAPYWRAYTDPIGIAVDDLLALGRRRPTDAGEPFTPAYLAIRGSGTVNGVSRIHGAVSRHLFADLFPRWPEDEVPVGHVTNGIHVPSWDSPSADALWEQACGQDRWRQTVETLGPRIRAIADEALWSARRNDRLQLIAVARRRLGRQLGYRGADAAAIARAAHALDPNVLTIGFARRFTAYKRPNLLLADPARLERLLTDDAHPVQLVVAGKAHPNDAEGKALITAWIRFADRPSVRERVVFLEDYDMTLAEELVRGVDVWLNTPRRPWEACGTSGMKTIANGGLNVSVLDGWWAEAFRPDVGWAIDSPTVDGEAADAVDAVDAERLFALLERDVAPEFYDRDVRGIPRRWLERVRASMADLGPRFSANRMVREYVDTLYVPAARLLRAREEHRSGPDLLAWHTRLLRDWKSIHFGNLEMTESAGEVAIVVPVYLGEVAASDVAVELYADRPSGDRDARPVRIVMERVGDLPGAVNGALYRGTVPQGRAAADFTVRVIPHREDVRIPLEAPLIAWQR